ncbi:MAG: hypothetical protein Rubg2KO_22810 [Rubricoccaceae bacterium]
MPPPSETPASATPLPGAAPDADAERLAGLADAEPSLREHLVGVWRSIPAPVRWSAIALVAVALAWMGIRQLGGETVELSEEEINEEIARARIEWAAQARMSPVPLGDTLMAGSLEPGDAEPDVGRFIDFYVHETDDSTGFSIVVTAEAFAPDLSVRTPAGRTMASSALLRTQSRAEVEGLVGPGRFELAVTSLAPNASGAYEVSVVPNTRADSVYADASARLDTLGSGVLRADRYERAYGVVTSPDQPVVIRVVSEAFRPRLHLLGPNGEVGGSWRTIERRQSGDSLHAVLVRYLPGWEAPYRLLVTSEDPGETGPFALDVRTIQTRDLRADGRAIRATLGPDSWLEDNRYVDFYRFRAREGAKTVIRAQSNEVPPRLRVWKLERRERTEVASAENTGGASSATIEEEIPSGRYVLEVTSGGAEEDSTQLLGGEYTLSVKAEAVDPPPPSEVGEGPVGSTRVFAAAVARRGQSGGNTFEVGVSRVAMSTRGSRTRIQLDVSVRSIDYGGPWAPWRSFAAKGYVFDDRGGRYQPAPTESRSGSPVIAEPGDVRRGTVVFYADGVRENIGRLVYVASLGGESSLTLPITVP